jgi:hypothetical protein
MAGHTNTVSYFLKFLFHSSISDMYMLMSNAKAAKRSLHKMHYIGRN